MLQQFRTLIPQVLGVNLNQEQIEAIEAAANDCLFIVAGPGSGKTTVLALRALKFIFVDGIQPDTIIATTFTRKAAKELRSRVLAWGDQLRQAFLQSQTLNPQARLPLERLDFNAIVTGTLDSIAESMLAQYRAPGTQPPVVIEEFVSQALMLRRGLFQNGRYWDQNLRNYVSLLLGPSPRLTPAKLSDIAQQIRERFLHDAVDIDAYRLTTTSCPVCQNHPHPGVSVVCDAIEDYVNELRARGVVDFPELEQHFLSRLQNGTLNQFANRIRAVLVDEYQDTNLLQEQIYFELTRRALANSGGITVVGDDDQSLFRFRGATVDLFQFFPDRLYQQLGIESRTVFLTNNYRSTQRIVDFCNGFVQLDSRYQAVRVSGKPQIVYARNVQRNPQIIGLFRDDIQTLARDLAQFIHQVFYGGGYNVPGVGIIQRNPQGSVGDCALLCHSPDEIREYFDQQTGTVLRRERLPLLLRRELSNMQPHVLIFNPRGQDLASVPDVERLCGLILECIDPQATIQRTINNLPQEAIATFNRWRQRAQNHISRNPAPRRPNSLPQFVRAWQQRKPQGRLNWPDEIHLAELAYKLVTWIPSMQDDIEGLVHLEVILRTITESGRFSNYGGYILFRPNQEQSSIRSALWDIFVPLAMGAVEVDEDLLETLPKDRLNILSIHQSKGLEFPMVIVDVGSDFSRNNSRQAFMRFPQGGDLTHNLENELRQFSPLGAPNRDGRDRAFDDLTRLYFVAFSRAQDVLVLVGLNSVRMRSNIPHVATGWDRSRTWHWGQSLPNLVHI
jgi:DNA helicase-2/ATP-dependent DNA helicase PcrA